MQLRGEAHLGVDDPVLGQILDALSGHALEGLGRLHDGHGVHEALQVAHEVAPRHGGHEPGSQLTGVGGRQASVALLGRQLDDRRRAKAAVEVVVQQNLRGRADLFESGLGAHLITSRTTGTGAGGLSPISIEPSSACRAQARRPLSSV